MIKRKSIYLIIIFLLFLISLYFVILMLKNYSKIDIKIGKTEVDLVKLWNKGEYKEIIDYSEQDIVKNPFDFNLNLLLGFSYFYYSLSLSDEFSKNEYLNKAIFTLRYLIAINPNVSINSLYYVLGKAYTHKGKYYSDLAVYYLKKAIDSKSLAVMNIEDDIYEYLAYSYQILEDYENSLKFYKIAYNKQKSDLALWNQAYINFKLENLKESEKALNQLISEFQSDNKTLDENLIQKVYILLGDISFKRRDFDGALKSYTKVLEINELNSYVYVKIGNIFRERDRDYIKARKAWREALRLNPYLDEAREKLNLNMENF